MQEDISLEDMYMLNYEQLLLEKEEEKRNFTYIHDITHPHFRDEIEKRIKKDLCHTVDCNITDLNLFPKGVDYCH